MHVTTVRARYAETDQAGVVYHASYLPWFEVGRTEMLRDLGFPYAEIERRLGVLLTVTEAGLNFHAPARYDEVIVVETTVTDVRRVRLRLATGLRRQLGGDLLCTGHVWLAAVTREGKPVPLPADLRACLLRLQADAQGSSP